MENNKIIYRKSCSGCEFLEKTTVVFGTFKNENKYTCQKENRRISGLLSSKPPITPHWCPETISLDDKITYKGKYYEFEGNVSLSKPVNVYPIQYEKEEVEIKPEELATDVFSFCQWYINNYKNKYDLGILRINMNNVKFYT